MNQEYLEYFINPESINIKNDHDYDEALRGLSALRTYYLQTNNKLDILKRNDSKDYSEMNSLEDEKKLISQSIGKVSSKLDSYVSMRDLDGLTNRDMLERRLKLANERIEEIKKQKEENEKKYNTIGNLSLNTEEKQLNNFIALIQERLGKRQTQSSSQDVQDLVAEGRKTVLEIWNLIKKGSQKGNEDNSDILLGVSSARGKFNNILKKLGSDAYSLLKDENDFLVDVNYYIRLCDKMELYQNIRKNASTNGVLPTQEKLDELKKEIEDAYKEIENNYKALGGKFMEIPSKTQAKGYAVFEFDGVTYVVSNEVTDSLIKEGLDGVLSDNVVLLSGLKPGINNYSAKGLKINVDDSGKITVLDKDGKEINSKYYDEVKKDQLGNYAVYEYNGVKYVFGNDLNSDKVRKGIPGLEGANNIMLVNSLKPGMNRLKLDNDHAVLINLDGDGKIKLIDSDNKDLTASYFENDKQASTLSLDNSPVKNNNKSTPQKVDDAHEASKNLLSKLKKNWKKIVLGVATLAVVATTGLGISNIVRSFNGPEQEVTQSREIKSQQHKISDSVKSQVEETNNNDNIDYQSVVNDVANSGLNVYSDAYSATSRTNGQTANQWFQYDSPVGVYNTATHSYQNLTADQLASLDALEALAQDPNNAVLFGESMQNASGFMNAQDLIQSIQK